MFSFASMTYREIKPGASLRRYVKCYYVYESSADTTFDDIVFPSGCTEIIFNLGEGQWQTQNGQQYETTPPIEFWGQIVKPLPVRSIGRNTMLGIRFLPQAAAHFINDKADLFNNQVVDYSGLSGNMARVLHDELLHTSRWDQRIGLVEAYLLQHLSFAEKHCHQMAIVSDTHAGNSTTGFF